MIVLTLGLVVRSLVRLTLCNDAFGLTMLRLSSMVCTEVAIDHRHLDTLTTDAGPVFATCAGRSPAFEALACRPDPDRSIWSRWDAARHRNHLGCPLGA